MKIARKILKIAAILFFVVTAYIGGNLLYGTLTDFKPEKEIKLAINGEANGIPDSVFTFLNWNIGYAGLGKESDFFYDGGESVRMSEELTIKNLNGITKFIADNDTMDFILLQEVDSIAKRTYELNEVGHISQVLGDYAYSYAVNYNVRFIPVPYLDPMGKVYAGVTSFSKHQPTEAKRYGFDANFSWPTSIYFLDRCFLLQRIPLQDGKEFVVINTHNSAYDATGELKAKELGFIRDFVVGEYNKGNYVVIGGDWNQCPPGFNANMFSHTIPDGYDAQNIEVDYFPEGWQWVYDTSFPTNRDLQKAYEKGETFTTLIDYYLVSPNLEVLEKQTINMDFEYSDHQPVYMKVKLK